MDLDGLGPIHRPGPTGQRLFISGLENWEFWRRIFLSLVAML